MVSNSYKVFPAQAANGLDKNKFVELLRYNLSGTKFIVEFIETPSGAFLTHSDALALMSTPEWNDDTPHGL